MLLSELETPHGACVILELDDPPLLGAEATLASSATRRREVALGRAALRRALAQDVEILADDRGAPVLPAGFVGSISHKGPRAAALVAPAGAGFVGIDLELAVPPRQDIGRRILTERERQRAEGFGLRASGFGPGAETTLVFAIKEAIYKAIDPIVRRYVGFQEVEIELGPPCTVTIIDPSMLPVLVEAWWTEHDGHWLATARARAL